MKAMRIRPGFALELVAAEPLVMDPVYMAWGPDGKLWVVEMADYPLGIDDRGKPGGRVRFLEDTDGDGRYDRSTVFMQGIGFPTAVHPWRDGVLVTAAPRIFFAKDADGDGEADQVTTLYEGFGEGNQQHRVNGFVWGLDNWLYVANGDSGGKVRSAKTGKTVSISGRDLRIRPDTGDIDPQTGQSQFGRNRDDAGNWFGCNNPNPMYQFVLEDHYLRRNPHVAPPSPLVMVAQFGNTQVFPIGRVLSHWEGYVPPDPGQPHRFTSACSTITYRDDLFPGEFARSIYTSEPVHNLVHRRVLRPAGLTFTSRRADDEKDYDFLASSDPWFRPTSLRIGPDGALWVADMYRMVIEHPEWVDDRLEKKIDLRAGHDCGRIYRVVPQGRSPRAIPRLNGMTTPQLVAALDSPGGWQRDTAQQMLIWRNDREAVEPLRTMMRHSERPPARLHAMCTLDGLGAIEPDDLLGAMRDADGAVRRHAVRIAEPRFNDHPALGEAAAELIDDDDPHVVQQAAYSLGEWRDARAGGALGRVLVRRSDDPYISAAAMSSAVPHADTMLVALLSHDGGDPGERAKRMNQLLACTQSGDTDAAMARVLETTTKPSDDGRYARWQFVAAAQVLDAADKADRPLDRVVKRASDASALAGRLRDLHAASRRVAADDAADVDDRIAAVALIGHDANQRRTDIVLLAALVRSDSPLELRQAAVRSLGRLDDAPIAAAMLDAWPDAGPTLRADLLDALIARRAWLDTLLDRIEQDPALARSIDTARRQVMLRHPDAPVRDRAAKLFDAAANADRQQVINRYSHVTKRVGDIERGRNVFVTVCSVCHVLDGAGRSVGPDLHTLTDRSPEALLTAILDPNRAAEDKYLQHVAVTTDGRAVAGLIEQETGSAVTLISLDAQRHTLLRRDIQSLTSTGQSLMPDGLESAIDADAMADLLTYLAHALTPPKRFAGNSPRVIEQEADAMVSLPAEAAAIHGPTIVFEAKYRNIGWWSHADAYAAWTVNIRRPGLYEVTLDYACHDDSAGNALRLTIADQSLTSNVPGSGTWDDYRLLSVGTITLAAGRHHVVVRSAGPIRGSLIDLRRVRLTPK